MKTIKQRMAEVMEAKLLPYIVAQHKNGSLQLGVLNIDIAAQAALEVVLAELESEELKLTVSSGVTNLIHDDVIAQAALKAAADRLRG